MPSREGPVVPYLRALPLRKVDVRLIRNTSRNAEVNLPPMDANFASKTQALPPIPRKHVAGRKGAVS